MIRYNCIWFTLDSIELENTVEYLARKYDAPIFIPHCTIIGRTIIPFSIIKKAIINYFTGVNPIEVSCNNINYGKDLWKSLFIDLNEVETLTYHKNKLCKLLGIESKTEYQPHISLMYKNIAIVEKERIVASLSKKTNYVFNAVEVIEWDENPEKWRTVFKYRLSHL